MSRGVPLDEDLWGTNPVDLERQLIKGENKWEDH